MNEQLPIQDRREARRQRRAERLANPSQGRAWIAGLILIALGAMFLLRNTGIFNIPLKNWWALFILLPALSAFDSALRAYQSADNQWTATAGRSLVLGLLLTAITAAFLFGINWGYFGPVLIILSGIAIIFNTTRGRRE